MKRCTIQGIEITFRRIVPSRAGIMPRAETRRQAGTEWSPCSDGDTVMATFVPCGVPVADFAFPELKP